MNSFITATGSYLPARVVTNEELADKLGLTSEQIFKSSGIRQRHWASPGEITSALGCAAMKNTCVSPEDIDYLIFGTMTSDRFIPGSSPAVQSALNLHEIPCLDIRQACCNTLYGLQLASALVMSGLATKVAVCLAEIQSTFLRLAPAAGPTSMLFGDGAATLIVSSQGEAGALEIVDVHRQLVARRPPHLLA